MASSRPIAARTRVWSGTVTAIRSRPSCCGRKAAAAWPCAEADPHAAPKIDLNAFAEPEDLETLLRGFKIARRILEAPAFKPYRGRELKPGPGVDTDEALKDYLRETSGTIYHPVGTCRMGSDADAVLDPELRLKGHRRRCAWSTPRSCRASSAATPTRRPSWSPRRRRT